MQKPKEKNKLNLLVKKHISMNNVSNFRFENNKQFYNNNQEIKNLVFKRRKSIETMKKPRIRMSGLESLEKRKTLLNRNSNKYINPVQSTMNLLETNLKNILNNMKDKIVKKNEIEHENDNIEIKKSSDKRFGSCPDFKIVYKSKKNANKNRIKRAYKSDSFNNDKTIIFDSYIKEKTIKRSNSFNISEESRKKSLRKLRNMMNIKFIDTTYFNKEESTDDSIDTAYIEVFHFIQIVFLF